MLNDIAASCAWGRLIIRQIFRLQEVATTAGTWSFASDWVRQSARGRSRHLLGQWELRSHLVLLCNRHAGTGRQQMRHTEH